MRRLYLFAAFAAAVQAQEPVGLLLSAGPEARVIRRDAAPAAIRVGDMLFAGDRLRTAGAPASYLYCPGKSSQVLDRGSEALFDATAVWVQSGKIASQQAVSVCLLPQTVQLGAASKQHAGALVLRDALPPCSLDPVRLVIIESCKHATSRAWFSFYRWPNSSPGAVCLRFSRSRTGCSL